MLDYLISTAPKLNDDEDNNEPLTENEELEEELKIISQFENIGWLPPGTTLKTKLETIERLKNDERS